MYDLVAVMDRLLGPGGCPWDRAQTHQSLKSCLIEEAYEVIEAIDRDDAHALEEELGDLLLQPVMHAQISAAAGGWDSDDVATRIVDKLIRRHPHVFGELQVANADEVLKNWDAIKRGEKGEGERSILEGVPASAPALVRALEVSKRAARAGFEWPDLAAVWEKHAEEVGELQEAIAEGNQTEISAEFGDLLFTVVNLARWLKVDPEDALRTMVTRFSDRFRRMESVAGGKLRELSPNDWDRLWNEAKKELAEPSPREMRSMP